MKYTCAIRRAGFQPVSRRAKRAAPMPVLIQEADFLYLLRESNLTKGNLSSHLAKLAQAGYVEIEKTYRGKVPLTLIRLTSRRQIFLVRNQETGILSL
jgi:hypothetical protein